MTAMDLAQALAREGIQVDRKRIVLAEPIKHIGDTEVEVRLHPEVIAKFKVSVAAAESAWPAAPRKIARRRRSD